MAQPQTAAGRAPAREPQRSPQRTSAEDLAFLDDEDQGGIFQDLDPQRIPDGMSYKGLRISTVGKADPRSEARGQRNRWTPVPKKRHPELVGRAEAEKDPEGAIIQDGLMLVERPRFITEAAAQRDKTRAKERVKNQIQSLKLTGQNQMPRQVTKLKKGRDVQLADPDREAGGAEEDDSN